MNCVAIILCLLLIGCATPSYRGMFEVGITESDGTRCSYLVGRGMAVNCKF